MIPKIKFREMTLKENIDMIKWIYYLENKSFDISSYMNEYFPELANLDKNLNKESVYSIISYVVTDSYKSNIDFIKKEVVRYNNIWNKYNDDYFVSLSKYLNINWPSDIEVIDASLGLIPIFPRNIDSFSFSLTVGLKDSDIIRFSAHETLHFLWFLKWRELYPNSSRKEFDSPYLPWKYSEMVTDPILNSKEFKNILNISEKSYSNFYEIEKDGEYLMEGLKEIFSSNKMIEDIIKEGFLYVKKIMKDYMKG